MHRKGLGGMDIMDNASIGAKSVRTHPLGKTQSKVVRLERESIRTNPNNSAYYGGAWVTCIFELTKNSDFSIVPKNVFHTASTGI